jgi:hypothetical protein
VKLKLQKGKSTISHLAPPSVHRNWALNILETYHHRFPGKLKGYSDSGNLERKAAHRIFPKRASPIEKNH